MPPRKPAKRKPSGTPRKRRGVKLTPAQLSPANLALDPLPEELAFLREGLSRQVLRKLRRGHWVIQDDFDLHGFHFGSASAAAIF